MKSAGNWKAWEKGTIRRIYVAKDKYLEEGETGLCSQSGNFTPDEIAFAYRVVAGKTFAELFEQVKALNAKDKQGKNKGKALLKERDEKLAVARTDGERAEIILEYAKLIKAAKYA